LIVFTPIAYPIASLLDACLGGEHDQAKRYSRAELSGERFGLVYACRCMLRCDFLFLISIGLTHIFTNQYQYHKQTQR
jgi:hypothetical protein